MKIHTKNYKSAISTFGRELDSKITILNSDLVLEKEDLYSVNIITNTDLLKSVMKEVDFESKLQIGEKQEVNIKSGIKVNGKYEYINYGNYIVYKSEYKAETNSYTHICYDKMLNTMIDYTPLDITYPINLREYINAIATKCGLEFANIVGTFANYDTPINKDNFSNGNYTFRDVLDYVAELVGGWFCINDDDKLEIKYPSQAKNYESDSGEEINFYTEVEDKIKELTIYGNSIQETRSGKNLLENKGISKTSNGITFTVNDDKTILANGNNNGTANSAFIINNYSLEAGTYILNGCPSGGSSTTYRLAIQNTSGWSILGLDTGSGSEQFTIDEATNVQVAIFIQKGQTISNLLFKPMIRLSSIIDDSYEPYGVSPSPDYPSEIESVGYENLLENNTITTTINGITFTKNADGTITANGTATANVVLDVGRNLTNKFKEGTYISSGCPLNGSSSTYQVTLFKTLNGTTTALGGDFGSGLIVSINETCYLWERIVIYSGQTVSNLIFKPQLEKGTIVHSYIPYGKYGIEVKNTGKNLFDENKYFSMLSNDNGVYTGSSSLPYTTYNSSKGGLGLIFEPNTSYTISFVAKNTSFVGNTFSVAIRYSDNTTKSLIVSTTDWKTYKFVTNETKSISMIFLTYYNNAEFSIKEFIISKTSDYTGYEPYQSTSSLFVLDQPLRSLPNGVKDIAYIKNNVLYVERYVGSVVLNGSESGWNVETISVDHSNAYIYIGNAKGTISSKPFSQYFIYRKNSTKYGEFRFGRVNKNLIFADAVTEHGDLNGFKTWLSTHNTQVDYELATPYTEEIGEVEIPSTFKGNNNITLSANINTNIDITYTKEYEEVDREFLKDVNVSFSKKYGPVNSVVFSRGGGSDNIYRKDYDSISANGLTEIKITDNPFLEDDERENFIQSVFDKLNGLEFYIMDVASTGITYLELGDLYYFNMSEDKPSLKAGLVQAGLRKAQGSSLGKYICLMLNDKIDITQGLSESIYVDEPDITETDYKTASITDKSIKNAIIQTNKNSAEILLKVNSDEVVSAINLSPEKIKIQSSKIDVDGVLSVLGKAGSTVINGANITTGSINCDRLNGGTINGQAIRGGSISITTGNYYFNMGTSTSNPNCSGLNVGNYGIKAYSDITATGFAITDSDTGKSQPVNIYDGHGHVHYLTFTGGILTKWEYK